MNVLIAASAGIVALIGSLGGTLVSWRLLRPNEGKIVAQAKDYASAAAERMLERYQTLVDEQEEQIEACRARIAQVEERERACEERAEGLATRVQRLELVLRRHGLNGELL